MADRTLIVGDLHLGKGLSIGRPSIDGSLNSRLADQIRLLNWCLDLAISKDASRIIITGDVFDELKPDANMVVIFMDWLKHCQDYGLDVHIIFGNHDLKRIGNRYTSILNIIEAAELENIFIYNRVYTLHTEDASFTFFPFRDRRSLDANTIDEAIDKINILLSFESTSISKTKVLIGHLAIEKSFWTDEIDDLTNEIMVPLPSFEGYDYVWMGHVHKPQVFSKKPYIAHIGSIDISDFGETEQEKVVVLFDSDGFEEIKLPTRPLKRIRLDIPKEENPTDCLLNEINKQSFNDAIVKIEIKLIDPNAVEIDRDKIVNRLYKLGAYYVSGFSESRSSRIISDDKQEEWQAIEPKAAVKLWASKQDFPDDERDEFISACIEVVNEHS